MHREMCRFKEAGLRQGDRPNAGLPVMPETYDFGTVLAARPAFRNPSNSTDGVSLPPLRPD
jgi:hypothetical protein